MESKNIKIVDEHGIDRVANIICSIDVDGSDYVIYWIERDNDNDNLFISKLLKNNDGTSTMMNIEDSMEKSNLSDIVKELITHAINDENDNIDVSNLTLKNGKNVKIAKVLFNKEQSINVQKTYITTVKKSVTKVSEKYYHVEESQDVIKETVPVVEEVITSEVKPVKMPSLGEVTQIVNEPEVVAPEVPVLEVPFQNENPAPAPIPEVRNNEVKPVIPEVTPVTPEIVPVSILEEVVSVEPVAPSVTPEVAQPMIEEPNIEARMNIIGANPQPSVDPQVVPVKEVPVTPESVATPNIPVTPVVAASVVPETTVVAPAETQNVTNAPNQLFFDGSKETNLAGIFDGNNDDTQPIVTTETVAPIREFGQDEPVIPIVNDVAPAVQEQPKTLTKSPGFANNKFFLVIALTFFIAACVFLGYEVFKYFQMR